MANEETTGTDIDDVAVTFGVAEVVRLATTGRQISAAGSLVALGVPQDLLADDVIESGLSTLIARELASLDGDGGWVPAGAARPVAHGLGTARRWVTLTLRGDDGDGLDAAVIVVGEELSLLVTPRHFSTYRIAALDDDGGVPGAILEILLAQLELSADAFAIATFTASPVDTPRSLMLRHSAGDRSQIELADGPAVDEAPATFTGVVDEDELLARIADALALDDTVLDDEEAVIETALAAATSTPPATAAGGGQAAEERTDDTDRTGEGGR